LAFLHGSQECGRKKESLGDQERMSRKRRKICESERGRLGGGLARRWPDMLQEGRRQDAGMYGAGMDEKPAGISE
jgi:hypothetical protein